MQDNERIYRIELTNEEYEFIENIRKELYNKFSKMNKEELLDYIKALCPEQELNFEKQIKGTTYKVNTYFSTTSEYTILQNLLRIFEKWHFSIEIYAWNMVYYDYYLKCSNYNFISYFKLSKKKGVDYETARKR